MVLIDICGISFDGEYGRDCDIPLFEEHLGSFGIEYDFYKMFKGVYGVETVELLEILDIGGDFGFEVSLWFVVLHDYYNIWLNIECKLNKI